MGNQAFLYDFDGLLVDSETAGLVSWRELYEHHGHQLDLDWWLTEVAAGRGPCMPREQLEALVGSELDWDSLDRTRLARRDALLVVRPGVLAHLAEARAHGVRLAVVSNAPDWWLHDKLPATGLSMDWFEFIVTKADGLARKPAADSYLYALRRLGIRAEDAIAFEDSPVGVRAALAAGIRCVAVPNEVTEHFDLGHATRVQPRLDSLPVRRLLEIASGRHDDQIRT
jgi:putative hydrolase of the HAD superfamily